MQSERQMKILEIISKYDVETQDELADYLRKAGFKTTQATISRDIRMLKLTKIVDAKGHFKYAAVKADSHAELDKYRRILRDGFISRDQAENILVLRTVPGMAMAVAASVDAMNWSQVAGSIAGDDNVFCAIRHKEDVAEVIDKIRDIIRES